MSHARLQAGVTLLVTLAFTTSIVAVARAQEVLPRPPHPFVGKIGRTVKDSIPDFPKEAAAPRGAPNILVIMTDDVGFAATSPFGGPIPTPTFERLAATGLRYTQFHTAALCFPPTLGVDHWAESSHQCVWGRHGIRDRLSWLSYADAEEQRHQR